MRGFESYASGRHGILLIVLFLFLNVSLYGAETKRLSTIAILDLASPPDSPWLGAAIAESLATRLSNTKQFRVLEREKISLLLQTASAKKPTPALLGADYIVTGSVQLTGAWENDTTKIRINTKLIAAQTAVIQGDAAVLQDGRLSDLFAIEGRLAETLRQAMGKAGTDSTLDYCEERTLRTRELFGEGLLLLDQVRALPGMENILSPQESESAQPTATTTLSQTVRSQAQDMMQDAIRLLRSAQSENMGIFFSRAHVWEARAREWQARLQSDSDKRRNTREETITQFRKDAADAAPAFFNLGRALAANNQHQEAIEAYDQYLTWNSENDRVIRWKTEISPTSVCAPAHPGRLPDFFAIVRHFRHGARIYCAEGDNKNPKTIVCLSAEDGHVLWKQEKVASLLPPVPIYHDRCADTVGFLTMAASDTHVFLLRNENLLILNAQTGELQHHVVLPKPFQDTNQSVITYYVHRIDIPVESDRYILVNWVGQEINGSKTTKFSWHGVVDTSTGTLKWHHSLNALMEAGSPRVYTRLWKNSVFVFWEDTQFQKHMTREALRAKCPEPIDLCVSLETGTRTAHPFGEDFLTGDFLSSRSNPEQVYVWQGADNTPLLLKSNDTTTPLDNVELLGSAPMSHLHGDYIGTPHSFRLRRFGANPSSLLGFDETANKPVLLPLSEKTGQLLQQTHAHGTYSLSTSETYRYHAPRITDGSLLLRGGTVNTPTDWFFFDKSGHLRHRADRVDTLIDDTYALHALPLRCEKHCRSRVAPISETQALFEKGMNLLALNQFKAIEKHVTGMFAQTPQGQLLLYRAASKQDHRIDALRHASFVWRQTEDPAQKEEMRQILTDLLPCEYKLTELAMKQNNQYLWQQCRDSSVLATPLQGDRILISTEYKSYVLDIPTQELIFETEVTTYGNARLLLPKLRGIRQAPDGAYFREVDFTTCTERNLPPHDVPAPQRTVGGTLRWNRTFFEILKKTGIVLWHCGEYQGKTVGSDKWHTHLCATEYATGKQLWKIPFTGSPRPGGYSLIRTGNRTYFYERSDTETIGCVNGVFAYMSYTPDRQGYIFALIDIKTGKTYLHEEKRLGEAFSIPFTPPIRCPWRPHHNAYTHRPMDWNGLLFITDARGRSLWINPHTLKYGDTGQGYDSVAGDAIADINEAIKAAENPSAYKQTYRNQNPRESTCTFTLPDGGILSAEKKYWRKDWRFKTPEGKTHSVNGEFAAYEFSCPIFTTDHYAVLRNDDFNDYLIVRKDRLLKLFRLDDTGAPLPPKKF